MGGGHTVQPRSEQFNSVIWPHGGVAWNLILPLRLRPPASTPPTPPSPPLHSDSAPSLLPFRLRPLLIYPSDSAVFAVTSW